ncbi:MAG: polyphosphate kinase 2 [Alphaproteobacteria bacterium]|nr:polyphosphate kinase 2 [Alphaproteobacteria bacterium]
MSKAMHNEEDEFNLDAHYKRALVKLQIELVKLQRQLIADGARVLIIFEGRDTAGKDGAIKRLTEHMSPRETRVHAPGKPTERDATEWYFQRFAPQLPAGGEFVVFNRSWYNRAGVERVMDFCTKEQAKHFLQVVVPFEEMLVRDGLHLRKYYLDISKTEQKVRLAARHKDPLKQWKISPVDEAALKKWKPYTKARDEMFEHTSHADAPWKVVIANDKKIARLEFLRDLVSSFDYRGKDNKLCRPDRSIVFEWSKKRRKLLAR